MKSVHIRGYSLCIQSECGKMHTKITPNTDTFYAVIYFYVCIYPYTSIYMQIM